MATTALLVMSAIYGPIIFTIYCAQVVIVIANKSKPQFRSSYFSFFVLSAIMSLASFLTFNITNKLPLISQLNDFYANFPSNAFTTALQFLVYYLPACEEYTNIFIALNRLTAITMFTKYEQIWIRFGFICIPVVFGFPFISYYHLVDVKAFFVPMMNGTIWGMEYDHSVRPWRSNRVSTFYLLLATSITTFVLNLISIVALRVMAHDKRSTVEIRLFLLGITSFACGLPWTYQQFVFTFNPTEGEMQAMFYRIPWLTDLKTLAPSILSLIFSPAIRNELIRVMTKRRGTYSQEVTPISRF